MHEFVFEAEPYRPTDIACECGGIPSVQSRHPSSDSFLVREYLIEGRPFVGNLGMGMTALGIIHIRVNTSLKDGMEVRRICCRLSRCLLQLNIEEGGYVTEV